MAALDRSGRTEVEEGWRFAMAAVEVFCMVPFS
jgi:hypothetical protein